MATVTIKRGDTLWDIAKKTFGDPQMFREIARLNGIKDPSKITVGDVLKLPGVANAPIPRMRPEVENIAIETTPDPGASAETTMQMTTPVGEDEFAEFSPAMQENARRNPNVAAMLRRLVKRRREPEPEPTLTPEEAAMQSLREQLPEATFEEGQAALQRELTKARFDDAVGSAPDVDPRYLGIGSPSPNGEVAPVVDVTGGIRWLQEKADKGIGAFKPWARSQGKTETEKKNSWLGQMLSRQMQDQAENGPPPEYDPRYFEPGR